MHRLDDLPDTVTRAECALTLRIDGARRDLEQCHSINETITFDKSTIIAFLDAAEDIAFRVASLRADMESHTLATAREWQAGEE